MTPAMRDNPWPRRGALLIAICTIAVGLGGMLYPEVGTALRRSYFETPARQHGAAAMRGVMGIVLLMAAASSRLPTIIRALGALMCLQALSGTLMGAEHARAVLEWEAARPTLLRMGAFVALCSGGLIAYAMTGRGSDRSAA